MTKRILGLDIGDTTLTGALVESQGRSRRVQACSHLVYGEGELGEALAQIAQLTGYRSEPCVVALPMSWFFSRCLNLPFTGRRQLSQVLSNVMADQLPLEVGDVQLDFQQRSGADGSRLLVAGIGRDRLSSLLQLMRSLGFRPHRVTVSGEAELLAATADAQQDAFWLRLDGGGARLGLAVGGNLAFFRSLATPLNGEGHWHDFAQELQRTMKIAANLCGISTTTPLLLDAVALPNEQRRSCAESLANIELQTWQPQLPPLTKVAQLVADNLQPAGMVRAVLLCTEVQQKGVGFDFCQGELKEQRSLWSRPWLRPLAAALVALSLGGYAYLFWDYARLRTVVEEKKIALASSYREIVGPGSKVVDPVRQLQVINSQLAATYSSDSGVQRPEILTIIGELSQRITPTQQVTINRLIIDAGTVRLRAVTSDFNTVDGVRGSLESSPMFDQVAITSATQGQGGSEIVFELRLELSARGM